MPGCRIDARSDAGADGSVPFASPDTIFLGLLQVLPVRDGRLVERLRVGSGAREGLTTGLSTPPDAAACSACARAA